MEAVVKLLINYGGELKVVAESFNYWKTSGNKGVQIYFYKRISNEMPNTKVIVT